MLLLILLLILSSRYPPIIIIFPKWNAHALLLCAYIRIRRQKSDRREKSDSFALPDSLDDDLGALNLASRDDQARGAAMPQQQEYGQQIQNQVPGVSYAYTSGHTGVEQHQQMRYQAPQQPMYRQQQQQQQHRQRPNHATGRGGAAAGSYDDRRDFQGRAPVASRFVTETLRMEIRQRSLLTLAQLDRSNGALPLNMKVPEMVDAYHSLFPLEAIHDDERPSTGFGIQTFALKGINCNDGCPYVLRRLDGRFLAPTREVVASAQEVLERWSAVESHPNILVPRAIFVSREIQDIPSLFIASDYKPAAITLDVAHQLGTRPNPGNAARVSDESLKSYVVQLVSAIRAAHKEGLYFRPASFHSSKLLLVAKNRITVGAVGVQEIIQGAKVDKPTESLFWDDLASAGKTIIGLACGVSTVNSSHVSALFDMFSKIGYSQELVAIVRAMLAPEECGIRVARQITILVAECAFDELVHAHVYNDHLMNELTKEVENGRILRILIKLGFLNERPEFALDPQWAETGDRYIVKLFRDFVFHQVAEDGSPLMDWGHVVECLNKLDAGVPERIMLLSQDEASMIVVSYADVKRCAENCYGELVDMMNSNNNHLLTHDMPHQPL